MNEINQHGQSWTKTGFTMEVIYPKEPKPKIKRLKIALSMVQRKELLEKASENNPLHALMIETLLKTGVRVNELCHFRIKDVNFKSSNLYIETYEGFTVKSKESNRRIPIERGLRIKLRGYIRESKRKTGVFFISRKKRPFNKRSIINFINAYAKECPSIKRTIGAHAFRRTYASHCEFLGLSKTEIMRRLGHSSVRTTYDYLLGIDNPEKDKRHNDIIKKIV